jgi:hypothetical protein
VHGGWWRLLPASAAANPNRLTPGSCVVACRSLHCDGQFTACGKLEEFDELLKAEKNGEPGRIPYRFTVFEEYPQHIVLGYIPKMSLVKEYIKVSLFEIIYCKFIGET